MNAKQRRQVRRAEERIEAARLESEYTEWATGYGPQARVTDRVLALVERARGRRRWPHPKATSPRWFRDPRAYGHRCHACDRKALDLDSERRWSCREHGDWLPF